MNGIMEYRTPDKTEYMVQDGTDYRELLRKFRAGALNASAPEFGTAERETMIVEEGGRTFVIKKEKRTFKHFDARMKHFLFGSPFLSVMKKVEKALAKGCDIVQRIYFVEETVAFDREAGTITVFAHLILEYLPGHCLLEEPDKEKYLAQMPATMQTLHSCKLLLLDCNYTNFVVSDGKLKVIDLYFFSTPFVSYLPRSLEKIKQRYDVTVPIEGVLANFIYAMATLKLGLIYRNRRLLNSLSILTTGRVVHMRQLLNRMFF